MVDDRGLVRHMYLPGLDMRPAILWHGGVVRDYDNFQAQYNRAAAEKRVAAKWGLPRGN